MPQLPEFSRILALSEKKATQFVWKEFIKKWPHWFLLFIDGGAGVGKTTILEALEKKALGLSNGDFFRGLNKFLTTIGLSEEYGEQIDAKLPSISIKVKLLDKKKRVIVSVDNEEVLDLDPEGSGDDGLKSNTIRRSFTDFLSTRPTVVAWWQDQLKETFVAASEANTPVVGVGRTNREFREVAEKRAHWGQVLNNSVLGYIYIDQPTLKKRVRHRAGKSYKHDPAAHGLSLKEYIQKNYDDDLNRTTYEMFRRDGQRLYRPSEAYEAQKAGIYDFVFNTSHLRTQQTLSLVVVELMYALRKNSEDNSIYGFLSQAVLNKFQVDRADPHLPEIEDGIFARAQKLVQEGKMPAAWLHSTN